MRQGRARAKVRFVGLSLIVANPIFLHLSTSFMTEIYGYFVAMLGACFWYRGKQGDSKAATIAAAFIVGCSFWIRQFCALIFPAMLLAEWLANRSSSGSTRAVSSRRAAEILVWGSVVAGYFAWASATGNAPEGAAQPASNILHPDGFALVLHTGVLLFYITVFFLPFLLVAGTEQPLRLWSVVFVAVLAGTAALTAAFGQMNDAPNGALNATFPFLTNVLSKYAVGPVTLSDVYFGKAQLTPHSFEWAWIVIEVIAICAAVGWARIIRLLREQKNEIALLGAGITLISALAVMLTYRRIFDRYHFPAILGFVMVLTVCIPTSRWTRLRNMAVPAITLMTVFSTLALHDYFRWQEARASLVSDAQASGLRLSDIYAGYEPDGWNAVEHIATSTNCERAGWFCRDRRYRIGVSELDGERTILSRPVNSWLIKFPNLKVFDRSGS
jgi:hypothetical protein